MKEIIMLKSMDRVAKVHKCSSRSDRALTLRLTQVGILGALVCGTAAALADPPVYSLTQVQLPAGVKILSGGGGGLNNKGDIALTAFSNGPGSIPQKANPPRGFKWEYANGHASDLGTLGGTQSSAFAINDCGDVTGSASLKGDKVTHAVVRRNGTLIDLDPRGAQTSFAVSINNLGVSVGSSFVTSDQNYHPVIFQDGAVRDLTGQPGQAAGINLAGEITGSNTATSPAPTGFVIKNGNTTILSTQTDPLSTNAINDFGDVLATELVGNRVPTGFVYQDGQRFQVPLVDTTTSLDNFVPAAISNAGEVVGTESAQAPPFTTFAILTRGQVVYNLNQLVDPKDPAARFVSLQRSFGVNDSGWIAAEGTDSRDQQLHIYLLQRETPAIQLTRIKGGCPVPDAAG
jgi:uncharacterized membrane protein